MKMKIDFSNLKQSAKGKEDSDNPYLTARRSWNEHVGSLVTQKQSWQVIALISLLICFLSVAGIFFIGSQSKFIPYIVEVDKLGRTIVANVVHASSPVDSRIVHASIAEFVNDIRLVTPDADLQRAAIFRVYAKIPQGSSAHVKAGQWFNGLKDSSPFVRAKEEMVSIQIRSVIPQSESTWQVEWVETTRSRGGDLKKRPVLMRALLTTKIYPPSTKTTEEQIRSNPLGIYVEDFSWSVVSSK